MGSQASRRHGLMATRRGRGRERRRRRRGWVGLSHSLTLTLCLASLLVSPLYPLSFFFLFFPWFFCFLHNSVWTLVLDYWLRAKCFVLFCFFLIDYLGHGLLGWGGSWLWTSRMMGWGGGSWYFGKGPELKPKGGPSPFFFCSLKILPTQIFFFGLRGGPGPLWDQRGSVPDED